MKTRDEKRAEDGLTDSERAAFMASDAYRAFLAADQSRSTADWRESFTRAAREFFATDHVHEENRIMNDHSNNTTPDYGFRDVYAADAIARKQDAMAKFIKSSVAHVEDGGAEIPDPVSLTERMWRAGDEMVARRRGTVASAGASAVADGSDLPDPPTLSETMSRERPSHRGSAR